MLIRSTGYEDLTETIIGCGIAVHRFFGAGLFESVYQACMVFELTEAKLHVEEKRHLPLVYKGHALAPGFYADLIVENTVLVEVKAVSTLLPVHQAQIITYLKLTGCPVGLLMNFNSTVLRDGIRRVVHPDLYVRHGTSKLFTGEREKGEDPTGGKEEGRIPSLAECEQPPAAEQDPSRDASCSVHEGQRDRGIRKVEFSLPPFLLYVSLLPSPVLL